MKSNPEPAEIAIAIEYNGGTYAGSFCVGNGLITVLYGSRQIITRSNGVPAVTLAQSILREIVAGNPEKF